MITGTGGTFGVWVTVIGPVPQGDVAGAAICRASVVREVVGEVVGEAELGGGLVGVAVGDG
ncbi:hypothetical protein [Paractinoplanes toevensis]|uniref:Uncharacterized protein n=1 Tax=Paractinoplanes toevensis TaxID=571911 RepID=A0A919T888_9ACTN|nr:hypothetical protein [Actinoplanes toevensis]GIM90673.1 hypothetical protein Ato02nite_024660 [Actinoplanes toevensis]